MNNNYLGPSSVILVAPVIAFGLGYAYFVGYFGFFGVHITALAIPPEHFFVQGALSFLIALLPEHMTFSQLVPLLSLIVLLAAVIVPVERLGRFRSMIAWFAVVPLLASGAFSAFHQGVAEAEAVRQGQPVFLRLEGVAAGEPAACGTAAAQPMQNWETQQAALLQANACGALFSIWQDDDRTIVGVRSCQDDDGSPRACYWRVYNISTETIAATATRQEELTGAGEGDQGQ